MALAVLTKSQDPRVLASVASCEDVIPLAFHSVPWQCAVGCMVMTDGLGQSKEMNFMLAVGRQK